MIELNENYWADRYIKEETGWDVGSITTPLKAYIDQLTDKSIRILIPGCGNGHEAEYLWKKGFTNVSVVDLCELPLNLLKSRNPEITSHYFLHSDFFSLNGTFDLIIEQTFFCAISPELREQYAKKCFSLLSKRGKLVGVLFNREFEGGPPFGGNRNEYITYFNPTFSKISLEPCYNSIKPRQGSELFMICEK